MPKNIYIIIGIVALVAIGGFLFSKRGGTPEAPLPQKQAVVPTGVSHTVTFSDTGYSPRELTVQKGDMVVFLNESTRAMWTATAIHPTHTIYPGSSILKCGTQERLFDSCGPVSFSQNWSFIFGEQGSWGYHDHLNVAYTGRIVVE